MNRQDVTDKIIKDVFQDYDKSKLFSWGVYCMKSIIYKNKPTLAMLVSGLLHNGWVFVNLVDDQIYDINLFDIDMKIVSEHKDIKRCEVADTIDKLVERKENWSDEQYRKLALQDSLIKMNK
jgi:hypothetical protein